MPRSKQAKEELGFSGYRFFSKHLHPSISHAGRWVITSPSRYERHEDLEYIFAHSGSGRIIVNNRVYPLQSGDAISLMSYCFHKFEADPGRALDLRYFRIPPGTYLYMLANPYVQQRAFDLADQDVPIARFDEPELREIRPLFEKILASHMPDGAPKGDAIFYALEFIGRFNRFARKCAHDSARCIHPPGK